MPQASLSNFVEALYPLLLPRDDPAPVTHAVKPLLLPHRDRHVLVGDIAERRLAIDHRLPLRVREGARADGRDHFGPVPGRRYQIPMVEDALFARE
jgi:hypothetical protein